MLAWYCTLLWLNAKIESVFWLVFKTFKPIDNRLCATPLRKLGFITLGIIDFVKMGFRPNNFSEFRFGWVDVTAFGVSNKVWFVVLEGNKCFFLRERLSSIVWVYNFSNGFGFNVDLVDNISF